MVTKETQALQDELKLQLDKAEKTIKWLAEKLHMHYDQVYYALNTSTKLETTLYIKIKQILDEERTPITCDSITGASFSTGAAVNDELSKLLQNVGTATADGKLTLSEKIMLIAQIQVMKNNINAKLNDLLKKLEA